MPAERRSDPAPVPALPRVLHWIWLGDAPLPAEHAGWMQGWERHHPGWTTRVWGDHDVPPLRNQAAFDGARSWAQKADVLRYEILLAHGGVYLDTDVECLRSIAPLAGSPAFAGLQRPGSVGNSVLGCTPGHPWMEAVVSAVGQSVAQQWLTLEQTGPAFLTRVTAGRSDVVLHPPEVFYPLPSDGSRAAPARSAATYAVHHWAKSWREAELAHVRSSAGERLRALLQPGDVCVLVDEQMQVPLPAGTTAVPFLAVGGLDHGPPADDGQALEALGQHLVSGTRWIVFLRLAEWWFAHYPGLADELRRRAVQVSEDAAVIAFRLR